MTTPEKSSDEDLTAAVVEQVLRCTADLDAASLVLTTPPRTLQAVAVAGQLVAEHQVGLLPGAPLTVWARGGRVNPAWTWWCPVRSGSAVAELGFLEQVYGPTSGDVLSRVLAARQRAHEDTTTGQ